ncbi:hypothetical protein P5673_031172 [Acropora cervicornis]|uniref:Uncharacterized protein n=1 Tax=Acropora cervicornis TaxID=6130 RepID=A0AAD9UT01_ACRCE|nr:hypothetical protein P5673_031172 [Acropora cervicornis]
MKFVPKVPQTPIYVITAVLYFLKSTQQRGPVVPVHKRDTLQKYEKGSLMDLMKSSCKSNDIKAWFVRKYLAKLSSMLW